MGKIKGWNKLGKQVLPNGDTVEFYKHIDMKMDNDFGDLEYETTVKIEQFLNTIKNRTGTDHPLPPGNYQVQIYHTTKDTIEEQWFSKQDEAKSYAIKWMKSHPNGA